MFRDHRETRREQAKGEQLGLYRLAGEPRPYHIDQLKVLLPYWSETPIGRITKAQARGYLRKHFGGGL
jgi:hypothetical protein